MSGPLRILHTVVNMNRGGAETLIMNLYRNMNRSHVQFDFLTSKPGVFDREIEELGGRIHRIPYISDVGLNKYIQLLEHFFKTHAEYQIVHSHMDKMSGLVLKAAQKAKVPIRVAHSHNTMSEGGYAVRLFKWYAGIYNRFSATNYLACSKVAAEWLFSGKASEAKLLYNGIECEKFAFDSDKRSQVRAELQIHDNTLVVGHVGRFLHQKNHTFLIDRFAELHNIIPDVLLVLAGDGPLRSDIEQQVKKLNLVDKVKFLGVRSDIDRLLQAFDFVVFPSFHEGLPVTLIEAQGAGLPCLISDSITTEVDMDLGLVEYFSLRSPKACLDKMLAKAKAKSQGTQPRTIPSNALVIKGYDITKTAYWLENYYTSHLRSL